MWKRPISTGQAPERKLKTLVVLMGFVRDDEGDLQPAFEPRRVVSEDKAEMEASRMAALGTYAGVITRSRTASLINGEFGEPVVLFQHASRRCRACTPQCACVGLLRLHRVIEPSRPLHVPL